VLVELEFIWGIRIMGTEMTDNGNGDLQGGDLQGGDLHSGDSFAYTGGYTAPDDGLCKILDHVKSLRGIDFCSYRPGGIKRRLHGRLSALKIPDFEPYLDYIYRHPDEVDVLIDHLTIKVSGFFRNPLVFELLGENVIPDLFEKFRGQEIRVWCAGCAHGEEAYSVAILFREIAAKEFSVYSPKVSILASDIDRAAIEDAMRGVYKDDSLQDTKKRFIDRHFSIRDSRYAINREIKDMVRFTYHDITTATAPKDSVFSDFHLILCRNTLIYFRKDICEDVMVSFSRFIPCGGYLVLGEAEAVTTSLVGSFEEKPPGTKIFLKKGGPPC
jgi:chemotaxis methyl-accepting protein methylase